MISLALLLQALSAPPETYSGQVVGRFSRSATLGGQVSEVVMEARRPGERLRYRFVLNRKSDGSPARRFEVTSGTCPAVAQVIAGLARLRPPALVSRKFMDGPAMITIDPVSYAVSAPVDEAHGGVTWTSQDGPVARWVDTSLSALEPCWRSLNE